MNQIPAHAFFWPDQKYEHLEDPDQDAEKEEGGGKAILCRACRHLITRASEKISVQGKHAHIFFNPAGLVFELGCFRSAPGCTALGRPTLEFTWFDGYSWRICVCEQCQNHLGWHYQNVHGPGSFYGLILSQLLGGSG